MPQYMKPCTEYIIMNTEWLLEAALVFTQTHCRLPWPMDNMVLTSLMLKCFHTILKEIDEDDDKAAEEENAKPTKEYGIKE